MANDDTGRQIGYARVSTREQNLDLQLDALRKAGVAEADIHVDKSSGANPRRAGLRNCLRDLREGDTLVTWKMDRLARSMRHLLQIVDAIRDKKANIRFLTQEIDTRTAAGKLIFYVFAAFAEFERDLTIERTRAGQAVARANGKHPGRPPKVTDAEVRQMKAALKKDSLRTVAARHKMSPTGVQKAIARVMKGKGK